MEGRKRYLVMQRFGGAVWRSKSNRRLLRMRRPTPPARQPSPSHSIKRLLVERARGCRRRKRSGEAPSYAGIRARRLHDFMWWLVRASILIDYLFDFCPSGDSIYFLSIDKTIYLGVSSSFQVSLSILISLANQHVCHSLFYQDRNSPVALLSTQCCLQSNRWILYFDLKITETIQ
jgi:hypothetical protein